MTMLHERFNQYRLLALDVSLLRFDACFNDYNHTEEEVHTAHLVIDKLADYYFYKMGTNI